MALNRSQQAVRGMTLIELLAAMAIFLALAGMVLQVLGGGLDLWSTGERTRETTDHATILLDRLEEELVQVLTDDLTQGVPRIRFHCDFLRMDADQDGEPEFRAQRLLFVRRLFEERTHPILREAGYETGDGLYFEGSYPAGFGATPGVAEEGVPADFYRPTEGMVEVALLPLPDLREGYEGRIVLWRALRTPIGGAGSLFESLSEEDGGLRNKPVDPLAENLLYVGYEFIDSSVEDLGARGTNTGSLVTWDSTRGFLPAGQSDESFAHGVSPLSLIDGDDDVFPRAIRISVILAPPPEGSRMAELQDELPADSRGIGVAVRNGRFLAAIGVGHQMVKIGQEWMEIGEPDGRKILPVRRAALGTTSSSHPAGAKVLTGRRFQRTIFLPTFREELNER